jgi:hypothetical protein
VIGIDFDNTIVCYDEVFQAVAVEQGLVPPHAATSKTAIRDHLRSIGQEDRWTELQGTIYGPRMMEARSFPGVFEFFAACRAAGMPVAIVSHRTRYPYLGERHDLHAAARDWLARHGFHDPAGIGLPVDRVFFEETKEAKLARISELGCTHFIDDLPELLAHPAFPADVRRILFDPHGQHAMLPNIDLLSSWRAAPAFFTGLSATVSKKSLAESLQPSSASLEGLLATAGLPPALSVERLSGGGNNRVYRVDTPAGPVLLKQYFRHAADTRDRPGAEQAFSRFAWAHGVLAIPQPLACNAGVGVGIYEFIPGRKLTADEVTAAHIDEAAAFFAAVNRHRHDPEAATLPLASEACFSLSDHLACVDRRLARLSTIAPESELHREAAALAATRLVPAWHQARAAVAAGSLPLDASLAAHARVISPSDFGFHNCIATKSGLKFIDFEYAGWDDPAKTVCDFFCQPAVPVPREHFERFFSTVASTVSDGDNLRDRIALLFPVYELKWCCIMLNEFLPVGDDRRTFAQGEEAHVARCRDQLKKVEAALARLDA